MAVLEGFVLDGLDLNTAGTSAGTWIMEQLDMPDPKKRYERITGPDQDGSSLVRLPTFEDRMITCRVRLVATATMDLALTAIGGIVDKLAKADEEAAAGSWIAITYTPANATFTGTFRCLGGEIEGLPKTWDGDDVGWFLRQPVLTVSFICDPFLYGAEAQYATVTETALPVAIMSTSTVPGDVDGIGRLVVTDAQAQNQFGVDAAIQNRYRDTASTAALFYEAETLTPLSAATKVAGPSGASGAGSNVIQHASLTAAFQGVVKGEVDTGDLPLTHVGSYRIKARIWRPTTNTGVVSVRMRWGMGDFRQRRYNQQVDYDVNYREGIWTWVDLGTVTIEPAPVAPQRWRFDIEAASTVAGDDINVDCVCIWPTDEGYAELRAVEQFDDPVTRSGATFANDATGGTVAWTSPGNAAAADAVYATVALSTSPNNTSQWLKATNFGFSLPATAIVKGIKVEAKIRGVDTGGGAPGAPNIFSSRAIVKGGVIGSVTDDVDMWPSSDTYRAWGGETDLWDTTWLFSDINASTFGVVLSARVSPQTARTAYIDHIRITVYYIEIPDAAVFASQSCEWRGERRAIREDSAGAVWANISRHRGTRLLVPPGVTRVMAKGYRTDPELGENAIDDLTTTLFVTPRWVTVPRQ